MLADYFSKSFFFLQYSFLHGLFHHLSVLRVLSTFLAVKIVVANEKIEALFTRFYHYSLGAPPFSLVSYKIARIKQM
jgi:hypothetical protein